MLNIDLPICSKLANVEVDRKALYEIVNSQENGKLNVVGFMV